LHLGDQQSVHTGDLEDLQAGAALVFFSDDVEDGVDELSALRAISLGPIVAGSGLTEY